MNLKKMAYPSEVTQALNCHLAIKELEKGSKLTTMIQEHLGLVLNGTNSQFGYLFDEISRTLAFSRENLAKSCQILPGCNEVMSHASEGTRNEKRRRDNELKNCQRRKYTNKRTWLTPVPETDGYQWRKYGQKKILSKTYPRCYYRCTYHRDKNCIAAKQVQQYNDEYPPLFEVTYFDEHTCNVAVPEFKSTNSQNILDFSGKSISAPNFSSNTAIFRREEEDAILFSCLSNVIRGYDSGIVENSNGGNLPKPLPENPWFQLMMINFQPKDIW